MDFDDFFIPQFFLSSFRLSPKLPRQTCGLFAVRCRTSDENYWSTRYSLVSLYFCRIIKYFLYMFS
jgi:hypothetical protein